MNGSKNDPRGSDISLKGLLTRFRWRVSLTLGLVIVESAIDVLFPLFIGIAINGLLGASSNGLVALGALAVAALVIGSARRFYDTRVYTAIYETTAIELVAREERRDTAVSAVAARATLLREFVEFLENSMPMILSSVIGLVGSLIIIASIEFEVFLACLGLFAVMAAVYWITGGRNFRLNQGYNDELERQVDALTSRDPLAVAKHFRRLMTWNRRLSDLETINYAVLFIGVIALLVYAPVAVVDSTQTEYGFVFSALMYVFQYIEGLVTLPLFIQQIIRLREISGRLAAVENEVEDEAAGEITGARPA
ncbi:MAG: ABC transporter six-transmembrane domain-containing protein [Gemmatimonadetes bacterium]|nr:ABC transporter six-transmembrane domain-containing protein [Gemmatimonadota bacterium]